MKKELLARDRERNEKVDKKTQALEVEIAELKAMMASGIALHSPIMSEKASHQLEKAFVVACSDDDDDVDECVPTPAPHGVLGQRSCELSVNTMDNKVAFGMVYPGKDKEKVHRIDIPLGHKCVSVDGLLKPNVLLPVSVRGEMVTVRDALGSFLAWPEGLISYTTPAAVLEFEMLGQAVLASYMTYLHYEMSEQPELEETFAFIDPRSTYYLNTEFGTYIVNRLKEGNPDRLFFLLPNQKALKSFNSETGRGNHKPSKVKFLSGSPKQPSGTECAYVVMRYMKEIINDTRMTSTTKWLQKTRMCYTEEQLDEYIMLAVDYVLKWVEVKALPTNDAKVVLSFLHKQIFRRFGKPRVIISDEGSYFCNLSNREIKRILEKVVCPSRKDWSLKLDEAVWAYRTAYKTPLGMSPFQLVYDAAGKKRMLQLSELDELQLQAYENNKMYKEKVKWWHDRKLLPKSFLPEQQVLLFNSRLRLFPGKLKSRWSRPFIFKTMFPHGAVETF
ncbi:hypothetical protein AgCh_033917 [Apium graveolens]